ncbi:MAG TPA: hypothetical protein VLL97_06765 [Acidobacteriota bacterium]|nr:hypothetical protein [Acidobacteriota bacterium]
MPRKPATLLIVITIIVCLPLSAASAMTINTHFIGGTPAENTSGSGNLIDIVNAAARIWEASYSDPIEITLYFGWASIGAAGNHTAEEIDGRVIVSSTLLFDNSGAISFFLDPTPYSNEEYKQRSEESQDFGGGFINTARIYHHPVGEAAGHVDLLSVALHEIGHALGLSSANPSFAAISSYGVIEITQDLPYAGTLAPLAYNNFGIVPHIDATEVAYGCLMCGVNSDERRIPSALEIVTIARISGFTVANVYPHSDSWTAEENFAADLPPLPGPELSDARENSSNTVMPQKSDARSTLTRVFYELIESLRANRSK